MHMKLSIGQRLEQKLKLAPQIIQSIEILQMNVADLRQKVEEEMLENPIMELEEEERGQDQDQDQDQDNEQDQDSEQEDSDRDEESDQELMERELERIESMQESGMRDAAILQSEEVLGPVSATAAQELKNSIQTKLESSGEYDRCGRHGV